LLNVTRHPEQTGPGAGLAMASVASVQFGAALATRLFYAAGPLGVVTLRTGGAAAVLLVLTRPWRRRWTFTDLRSAGLLGLVIVAMNTCLYLAIDRLPLATGVTLELLGPMTLRW
jgi:inner membrane transporter RhtA